MPKSLTRDFIIYGLGTGLSQSLFILLVPIYTQVFSSEEYGAMEIIQSGFILVSILGLLQLESAVGRFYFEAEDLNTKKNQLSTGFWMILLITTLVSFIIIFLAPTLSELLFSNQDYYNALIIVGFMLPFANLFNYFTVLIRFEKNPIAYGIITLIQLGTTLGLAICLVVWLRWGIEGVFYAQATGFIVGFLCYLIFFRKYLGLKFDEYVLKKYLRFSIPMVPGVMGNWANHHANKFVMLNLLSVKEVGLYAVAVKIASVFKLLEYAFRMAWNPFFIEIQKKADHRKVYRIVLKYVIVIISVLICLFALFASEIVKLVTNPSYYDADILVSITAFAFSLVSVSSIVGVGTILTSKTIYNTYSSFAGITINFTLLFILIPFYGLVAVPFSMLCGFITSLVSQWYFSEKLYKVGYSKIDFGLFFVFTLLFCVLCTFVLAPPFLLKIIIGLFLIGIGYFLFRKITPDTIAGFPNV